MHYSDYLFHISPSIHFSFISFPRNECGFTDTKHKCVKPNFIVEAANTKYN